MLYGPLELFNTLSEMDMCEVHLLQQNPPKNCLLEINPLKLFIIKYSI